MASPKDDPEAITVLDPEAITNLDPDGDIIISVEGPDFKTRLRCSSQVLSLSSPVFKRMLSPGFKEGGELQASRLAGSTEPLTISLTEDFPDAMAKLLHHLHHVGQAELRRCNLQESAAVAVQADKYACQRSVHFWAGAKMAEVMSAESPTQDDIIALLVIIDKCGVEDQVKEAIACVQWHMTADFESTVKATSWYCQIGSGQFGSLLAERTSKLSRLQIQVYTIQRALVSTFDKWRIGEKSIKCSGQSEYPCESRRCVACQSSDSPFICTQGYRIRLFFVGLAAAKLWPDPIGFCNSSIRLLYEKLKSARAEMDHRCSVSCPLMIEMDKVIEMAGRFSKE